MSDWRAHAASGNWRGVRFSDIEGLAADERAELIAALHTVAPKRTRGEGLETLEEPVRPEELKGVDAMKASFLLRGLLREENRLLEGGPRLFKPAISMP